MDQGRAGGGESGLKRLRRSHRKSLNFASARPGPGAVFPLKVAEWRDLAWQRSARQVRCAPTLSPLE